MAEEDGDAGNSSTDEEPNLQGCMGYIVGPPPVPQVAATLESQSPDALDWACDYPIYLGVLPLSHNHFIT